jgi:D-glycero-alpha-D-manno-heptose-7-phosphate kinase
MTVFASAPCRADLAGGTLDLWPICHLLDLPARTVNLALDLPARAWAEARGDGFVEIQSEDRGDSVRFPARAIRHDRLGLATRLVAHFGAGGGLRLRLHATAPPQSGLGGSSALAVAVAGALAALAGRDLPCDLLLRIVQNVETAELGTLTGYQDYVPALFGGLHVLTSTPEGVVREKEDGAIALLEAHLLLVDTRVEHQSGLRNWDVARAFLDGDARVRASLRAIAAVAGEMVEALRARDLRGVASALDREWAERKRLAPAVSNARIEAVEAAARGAGALAAKICGAGGGGCLAVLAPGPDARAIREAVESAGARVVPWRADRRGLVVTRG